jgi:phosphoribosylglycinamide formyltransferase
MHILSPAFLDYFLRRVINLHPALPGEFDGANAIVRAWESHKNAGLERTGAMIHWVIPKVDAGEVIISREVEFLENDTLDSFEARLHSVEHLLIVEGVRRALKLLSR